ncbi:MAG: FxsA family protein [Acidimicrobiia bacterium]
MLVLVLLFVVAPIAELYVIVQASHAFGFLNTLGLLIVISFVGAWLVKREGLRVWSRFQQQVASGQSPSREIADGVCVLLAGALLIAPGFLSDVVGILLLLPPTRALLRPWLVKRFTGRTSVVRASYRGPVHDTTEREDPPRGQLGA